jgi:hypothetical protein
MPPTGPPSIPSRSAGSHTRRTGYEYWNEIAGGSDAAARTDDGAGAATIGKPRPYRWSIGYGTNWFRPIAFDQERRQDRGRSVRGLAEYAYGSLNPPSYLAAPRPTRLSVQARRGSCRWALLFTDRPTRSITRSFGLVPEASGPAGPDPMPAQEGV